MVSTIPSGTGGGADGYDQTVEFMDRTPASHADRLGETERRVRFLREVLLAKLLARPFPRWLPQAMAEESIANLPASL